MKKSKKIISIVLAVMMLIGCMQCTLTAFAAGSKDRYSVLVLDCSGSMSGSPINELKKGATAFCEQVLGSNRSSNKIAIVTFASSSSLLCDFTSDMSTLTDAISNLYASGGTDLAAGLNKAKGILEKIDEDAIKNMVVMCDGEPNSASSAYNVVESLPLHWNIYGLYYCQDGFSSSAENVMKNVGRNAYYKVEDGSKLVFSFVDNGTTITKKSVNKVQIRIACPVDVSVICNGVTLNKSNPKTTFGTLEIENVGGDEIKNLTLSYRNDYEIKINGYDEGTMDYQISYKCNDDELYNNTYPTVNVTEKTIITTGTDIDKANDLNIDADGDGIIDSTVSANVSVSNLWYRIKEFFKELYYKIVEFFSNIFSK